MMMTSGSLCLLYTVCRGGWRSDGLLHIFGRGQPLSFTLSFGEPWFDEEGEIRRCDWLERNP